MNFIKSGHLSMQLLNLLCGGVRNPEVQRLFLKNSTCDCGVSGHGHVFHKTLFLFEETTDKQTVLISNRYFLENE